MSENRCGPAVPPRKVSIDEAVRTVQSSIDHADTAHAAQLTSLQTLRRVKNASLAREQSRLTAALGADHPRVAALTRKVAVNQNLSAQLQRAVERVQSRVPQADAETWVVHGHVRTRDLKPVPQVTVALYTGDGQWVRPFGHDCTDANGHFKLCAKAGDVRAAQADTDVKAVRLNGTLSSAPAAAADTTGERGIFLRVTDSKQMLLGIDAAPLMPRPGQVDYREIILDGTVCAPPPGGDPGPPPRGDTGATKGDTGTISKEDTGTTTKVDTATTTKVDSGTTTKDDSAAPTRADTAVPPKADSTTTPKTRAPAKAKPKRKR